jgi:hypothetical protein
VSFTLGSIGSGPVLAVRPGTFVVVGIVLGAVLVVYAVYYFFFKLGK